MVNHVSLPHKSLKSILNYRSQFFDRVNHDSLMARIAARVTDKRVLKLIRAFLKSCVMEDGLVTS